MLDGGERRRSARILALEEAIKCEAAKAKEKQLADHQQQDDTSATATNTEQQGQPLPRRRGRKKKILQEVSEGNPNTGLSTDAIQWLPEKGKLEFILNVIQSRDTRGFFAQPVDPKEVGDYYKIIQYPMDFGTMRAKLEEGSYTSFEKFENDVYLICNNAILFNPSTTVYYRQARAIYELAKRVFHAMRTNPENIELEFSLARKRNYKKPAGSQRYNRNLSGGRSLNLLENDRRLSYMRDNESIVSSVYNSPHSLLEVDQGIGYTESLLRFVKDLGPTVQKFAMRTLGGLFQASSLQSLQTQTPLFKVSKSSIPPPPGSQECTQFDGVMKSHQLQDPFRNLPPKSKVITGSSDRWDTNQGSGYKGDIVCSNLRLGVQSTFPGQKVSATEGLGYSGLLENIPSSSRGKVGQSRLDLDLSIAGTGNFSSIASTSSAWQGGMAANTSDKMDISNNSKGKAVQDWNNTYLHGVSRASGQKQNQLGSVARGNARKDFRTVFQVEKPISAGGIPGLPIDKMASTRMDFSSDFPGSIGINTVGMTKFPNLSKGKGVQMMNKADQHGFSQQNQSTQLNISDLSNRTMGANNPFQGKMGNDGIVNISPISKGKIVQTLNKPDQHGFVRGDGTQQNQVNQFDAVNHSSTWKDSSTVLQGAMATNTSGMMNDPIFSKRKWVQTLNKGDQCGFHNSLGSFLSIGTENSSRPVRMKAGSSQLGNLTQSTPLGLESQTSQSRLYEIMSRSNNSSLLPNLTQAATSSQNLGGGEVQTNARTSIKSSQSMEWTLPKPLGTQAMNDVPSVQEENSWGLDTLVPLDLQLSSNPRGTLEGNFYEMAPLHGAQGESSADQCIWNAEQALLDFQLPDLALQL